MSSLPTMVLLQRERDFVSNDHLLSETSSKSTAGASMESYISLFREHLPCAAYFHFISGPVPECFISQTHATNQKLWLFEERHFYFYIGDQWGVPYGCLPFANAICKCTFVNWRTHQEFGGGHQMLSMLHLDTAVLKNGAWLYNHQWGPLESLSLTKSWGKH